MPASQSPPRESFVTRRFGLPAVLAIIVILLDQLTKLVIVRQWPTGSRQVVIPHFFHLVHLRNTGAAWGLFSGATLILALLSVLVLAFLIWKFTSLTEGYPERAVAIGMIAGGIVGNLIDRIWRGEVVDFLLFFFRSYHWPAFNIADSAICCGVVLFIASTFFRGENQEKAQGA